MATTWKFSIENLFECCTFMAYKRKRCEKIYALFMSLYQLDYNKNESAILNTKKDWFTIYFYMLLKK